MKNETADGDRSYTQQLLDELEAQGRIVRTGEMRPGRNGKLEPVYVLVPEAKSRH